MKEIGDMLRTARESHGLSVDDLYARTRIRQRIIEALESGNFDAVPGGAVYAKGFIRTICEELGIDYHSVVASWQAAPAAAAPTLRRPSTRRQINWVSTFGALIMIAALVGAGYYYMHYVPRPQIPVVNPVDQPPAAVEPEPTPQPDPEPVRPAFVFLRSEGSKDFYAVETWPMTLEVSVREGLCWVSVTPDKGRATSVTLSVGQSQVFEGTGVVEMRLGNAKVVDIKINGEQLPGQTGDVRDYTFIKTGP